MKRTPLRSKGPTDHRGEPGYDAFKTWVYGECAGCGERMLCLRHHVVTEQRVRAEGGDPWDLRNSVLIGAGYDCACHRSHHHVTRRLPLSKVPPEAREFARELLGEAAADDYLADHYAT